MAQAEGVQSGEQAGFQVGAASVTASEWCIGMKQMDSATAKLQAKMTSEYGKHCHMRLSLPHDAQDRKFDPNIHDVVIDLDCIKPPQAERPFCFRLPEPAHFMKMSWRISSSVGAFTLQLDQLRTNNCMVRAFSSPHNTLSPPITSCRNNGIRPRSCFPDKTGS